MSDIRPEVTERLTTFLYERFGIQAAEALADFVWERTAWGDAKYGTPLLPFDGRNTLMDALEEATDLSQYLMKRVMENKAMAELFEEIAQEIPIVTDSAFAAVRKARNMAAKLRADVKRSVSVGGV